FRRGAAIHDRGVECVAVTDRPFGAFRHDAQSQGCGVYALSIAPYPDRTLPAHAASVDAGKLYKNALEARSFMKFLTLLMGMLMCSAAFAATDITIATVNNPQMLVMQKLTPHFEEKYPDINVHWAIMPEAELRRKVTIDIATGAGQYDVVTVG